jgi:multiple sugar transport system substrate-binding protein
MMKIIFKIFVIMALIFGGCSKPKEAKPEIKEKVKLTYAVSPGVAERKIVEKFNETHPDIEVELVGFTGDTGEKHDRYVTMLSMKSSEYDVLDCDVVWVAEFASAGYVMPLDEYIERDSFDLQNYLEATRKSVTYDNKIWGIPRFTDLGLLYYRKDIVEKPPKTWNELTEQAKKYMGGNGTQYGFVFQARPYEGMVANILEYIRAYGGQVIDEKGNVVINSPQAAKGLKKFAEIVNSDYVPKDIKIYREGESEYSFLSGKSVFLRSWPYIWAVKDNYRIRENVGIAPLPKGDAMAASTLGGWVAMVNRNTKHPDEAWEFVKFLAGPQGQKIQAISWGLLPAYAPLYRDLDVLKANPYFENPDFLKAINTTVPRPVSPFYLQISDIIQLEVSKLIEGEQSVEEALEQMEKQIKEAVKDIK